MKIKSFFKMPKFWGRKDEEFDLTSYQKDWDRMGNSMHEAWNDLGVAIGVRKEDEMSNVEKPAEENVTPIDTVQSVVANSVETVQSVVSTSVETVKNVSATSVSAVKAASKTGANKAAEAIRYGLVASYFLKQKITQSAKEQFGKLKEKLKSDAVPVENPAEPEIPTEPENSNPPEKDPDSNQGLP